MSERVSNSRHGTIGIAGAWLILYPMSVVPLLYVTARVVLPMREYLAGLRAPAVSTLGMAAAVAGVGATLPGAHPALRLGAMVATGGVVYVGIMLVGFGGRVRAFVDVLRAARAGQPPAPAPAPAAEAVEA